MVSYIILMRVLMVWHHIILEKFHIGVKKISFWHFCKRITIAILLFKFRFLTWLMYLAHFSDLFFEFRKKTYFSNILPKIVPFLYYNIKNLFLVFKVTSNNNRGLVWRPIGLPRLANPRGSTPWPCCKKGKTVWPPV